MKAIYYLLFGAVILIVGCRKDETETSTPLIDSIKDVYFVDIDSVNEFFQGPFLNTRGQSSSTGRNRLLYCQST